MLGSSDKVIKTVTLYAIAYSPSGALDQILRCNSSYDSMEHALADLETFGFRKQAVYSVDFPVTQCTEKKSK